MRTIKRLVVIGTALGLVAAFAAPSLADEEIDVSLSEGDGSRTLFVENLAGAPLTEIDYGDSLRAHPYRVRVVDAAFPFPDSDFTVETTMTNLYKTSGAGHAFGTKIGSDDVSVDYLTNPVSAQDLLALVDPVLDLVAELEGALCDTVTVANTALGGILPDPCTIEAPDVEGLLNEIGIPVDLTDLPALPLIPSVGDTDNYEVPDFTGFAGADPAKPAPAPAATSLSVLNGDVTGDLGDILAAIGAVLDGLPLADLVDPDVIRAELKDVMGLVFDALPDTAIDDIVAEVVATVDELLSTILALTGTFLSFPVMSVDVPDGTPAGDYEGVLAVTLVQA